LSEQTTIPQRRRAAHVAATVALAALTIGLLGEALARLRGQFDLAALTSPSPDKSAMGRWAHVHPYAAYVPKPCFDPASHKSVSKFGFVSTPRLRAVEKAPGTVRVAFLGGSSTAGDGTILSDEDTWPYQTFVRLLQARPGLTIEIINASAVGYTSFDSFGRLWSQLRFFAPDIVIDYEGWNEMYYFGDASPERIIHLRYAGDRDWAFPAASFPPAIAPSRWDRWLGWSQLYGLARVASARRPSNPAPPGGEVGGPKRSDAELAADFDPRGAEVFRQNLLLMKAVCDLIGAEFYVVKQVTLITPDLPAELRAERCYTWRHAFNYDAHLRAWAAIYRMIDATFPPARVIDATPLNGRPDLLFDHTHPTLEGCRALADLVSAALLRNSAKLLASQ
jgi:hypothetical protein